VSASDQLSASAVSTAPVQATAVAGESNPGPWVIYTATNLPPDDD
jgi:hypothetical protein